MQTGVNSSFETLIGIILISVFSSNDPELRTNRGLSGTKYGKIGTVVRSANTHQKMTDVVEVEQTVAYSPNL